MHEVSVLLSLFQISLLLFEFKEIRTQTHQGHHNTNRIFAPFGRVQTDLASHVGVIESKGKPQAEQDSEVQNNVLLAKNLWGRQGILCRMQGAHPKMQYILAYFVAKTRHQSNIEAIIQKKHYLENIEYKLLRQLFAHSKDRKQNANAHHNKHKIDDIDKQIAPKCTPRLPACTGKVRSAIDLEHSHQNVDNILKPIQIDKEKYIPAQIDKPHQRIGRQQTKQNKTRVHLETRFYRVHFKISYQPSPFGQSRVRQQKKATI
jgi:hypothetical protein